MHYYQEIDKIIALHYATQLGDIEAKRIIESGHVNSSDEARVLSKFYWAMVKASVKDRDQKGSETFDNMDLALEGLHNTFSIHLCNAGFDEVWDGIVDEQD